MAKQTNQKLKLHIRYSTLLQIQSKLFNQFYEFECEQKTKKFE